MPKAIDHVERSARLNFAPNALAKAPILAARMMQVVAIWAHIDRNMASIFSRYLKADIAVGTELFDQFQSVQARRRALIATSKSALPQWQALAIEVVCDATKVSLRKRNLFAHDVAGVSPDILDAVLLVRPQVITAANANEQQSVRGLATGGLETVPIEIDRNKIFVWTMADLDDAVREALGAHTLFNLLSGVIGYERNEQVRRELWSIAEFQQAKENLLKKRKANPYLRAQMAPPGDDPPAPGIWKSWDQKLGRDMTYWESQEELR